MRRPTSCQTGPLPRTWRSLTNSVLLPLGRDPAGHGGDLAPWRLWLRWLQLLGCRPPPPCGAPARPGLLRHVPVNFRDPRDRLSAALCRPRPPGIRSGSGRARGHLLGRAAAPPQPLPPAAPSARLRARTGLSRPLSPAQASLFSAWRSSRSSFPVQIGVWVLLLVFCFFPRLPHRDSTLEAGSVGAGSPAPASGGLRLGHWAPPGGTAGPWVGEECGVRSHCARQGPGDPTMY